MPLPTLITASGSPNHCSCPLHYSSCPRLSREHNVWMSDCLKSKQISLKGRTINHNYKWFFSMQSNNVLVVDMNKSVIVTGWLWLCALFNQGKGKFPVDQENRSNRFLSSLSTKVIFPKKSIVNKVGKFFYLNHKGESISYHKSAWPCSSRKSRIEFFTPFSWKGRKVWIWWQISSSLGRGMAGLALGGPGWP